MKRVFSRRIVLIALLALQILTITPTAMAMGSTMASSGAADCAEDHGGASDDCPCCPEGFSAQSGCAALCMATFTLAPTLAPLALQTALFAVLDFRVSPVATQTYSPANPPPIR